MRPNWSLVMCAHNNLSFSAQAIDKILKNSPQNEIELILVDDGSADGTYEFFESLSSRYPFIHSFHHLKNQGYIKSVNDGLRIAKGQYLVCVNNDVLVTALWLQKLTRCIECMKPKNEFGLVGPATNFCAGRQQVSGVRYDFDKLEMFAEAFSEKNCNNWMESGFLSGFLLMIKKKVYRELGGFDEQFSPGGFEDNSYCLDARTKGWRAVIAGDTFVHHFGHRTFDLPEMRHFQRGISFENTQKYLDKYRGDGEKLIVIYRIKNCERWIESSLKSSTRFADQVLVLDDGSTDKTAEIAKRFAKVKLLTQHKPFNERRDREYVYNWAKKEGATWIAVCDGDEVFDDRMTKEYANWLMHPKNPTIKAYIFRVVTFWRGRRNIRVDSTFNNLAFNRMYKVEPNQHLKCAHPQGLHMSHAPEFPLENLAWCPVRILHYGYEKFSDVRRKYKFYQKIDEHKKPELIGGEDYSHLIDESNLSLRKFQPQNRLGLVTMIRNEGGLLRPFLDRTYPLFDQMVFVVDSRTKDKTREIVKWYGATCEEFKFNDSFSEMRNFAKSLCKTDWILQLDPDEQIPLLNKLLWYLDAEKADAFIFAVENFQPTGRVTFSESYRMFRNVPELYYEGRVHETIEASLAKMKATVKRSDVNIKHTGYLKGDVAVEEKLQLYARLNELQIKDNPKDARPYFNLALHCLNDGDRPKGIKYLEKAKKLDPTYYLPHKELGLTYLRMSREELGQVLQVLPKHHPMYQNTAELFASVSEIVEEEVVVGKAAKRRT